MILERGMFSDTKGVGRRESSEHQQGGRPMPHESFRVQPNQNGATGNGHVPRVRVRLYLYCFLVLQRRNPFSDPSMPTQVRYLQETWLCNHYKGTVFKVSTTKWHEIEELHFGQEGTIGVTSVTIMVKSNTPLETPFQRLTSSELTYVVDARLGEGYFLQHRNQFRNQTARIV
jgi:hypothetical protein